jgi:antitoxin protein of toxin-antitoxin system
MPKIKNLAALAAAVEAARRYARSNPEKAGKYLDQAAAFLDKQTKGKYSGQIDGVVDKVKGVAGVPRSSRTQGFTATAGYGSAETASTAATQGPSSRTSSTTTPPVTPTTTSTTTASPSSPSATVPPTKATVDPERPGEHHFPGSKDV